MMNMDAPKFLSLERPGQHQASSDLSAADVSAVAVGDDGGTASPGDAVERVIAETRAECFRFGGERLTCRLAFSKHGREGSTVRVNGELSSGKGVRDRFEFQSAASPLLVDACPSTDDFTSSLSFPLPLTSST